MFRCISILLPSVWMLVICISLVQAQPCAQLRNSALPNDNAAKSASPVYDDPVLVGTMSDATTCISRFTNQVGYDWMVDVLTLIYRAGPMELYPNQGRGSLVLNASTNSGYTWTGNSPIFNDDVPGNIEGKELAARHPNIFLQNLEGTIHLASLWSTLIQTPHSQDGILGEPGYKAGALGGPYLAGTLEEAQARFHFPSRIVSDMVGTLYALVQLREPTTDTLTGNFALITSSDDGISWQVDVENPALRQADIPPFDESDMAIKVLTEEAISMDVSPDGSTLYIGYVAITPGPERTDLYLDYTQTYFGYIYSTDGGQSWSRPNNWPIDTWTLNNPTVPSINTQDASVLPAIATVVDGLNEAHFLIAVDGKDRFSPPYNTWIGELTVNITDTLAPCSFFALRQLNRASIGRMVEPPGKGPGPQNRVSIFPEPGWSKQPNGIRLLAKWIDTDSIYRTSPAGYPEPRVRDTIHDIYATVKDILDTWNGLNGWLTQSHIGRVLGWNVTSTPHVDEKFTKMPYYINPGLWRFYIAYTIMCNGEYRGGYLYPDNDIYGPAELFFLTWDPRMSYWTVSAENVPVVPALSLSQNYPNPARASTGVGFTLERPMNVRITVSDLLGRMVATVSDSFREAGDQQVQIDVAGLPAGQYIYRLEADGQAVTRMMSVVR